MKTTPLSEETVLKKNPLIQPEVIADLMQLEKELEKFGISLEAE